MTKYLKKIKKYLTNLSAKAVFYYTKYYEEAELKDEILIQSYDGTSISGNPYYILLELCRNNNYTKLKKYVVANKENAKKIKKVILNEKLDNVEILIIHTRKYCKKLAEAKYLINNSTFPTYFIKKDEQIYLNTWHGTPLKAMGKNIIDSPHELGNTQRNLIMSDYLLFQNDFMFEKMKDAYMLNNLYSGKYVISGYPRNDIFFDKDSEKKIRHELGIDDKKVVVYMPTWRGTMSKRENGEQTENIVDIIDYLEKSIDDKTIMYVKIHNMANVQINYDMYEKIRPFPEEYETYRFLNVADCLITDYSSVMFDFANTGKKIILYIYDYEEYTKNRGFYLNVKEMPFSIVYNKEKLCNEINNVNNEKTSYLNFKEKFCCYDSSNTSKKVCELLLQKNESDLKIIDGNTLKNKKKNILIFTGALQKNGITTALKGLINNIDLTHNNYYLTFYRRYVKTNSHIINTFPDECNYIPIQGQKNFRLIELIASKLYFKYNIENKWIRSKLEKIYTREIKRIYPNIKFDITIDFCGYDRQPINMISYMDTKKIRFTHSDMSKEQKLKNNIHIPSLKYAYKTYDKIAVVRDSMINEVKTHFKDVQPKDVEVVHNINDIKKITEESKKKIEFSDNTYSSCTVEEIENILNDKNKIKFINIGRFSKEKGQDRLVRAFNKVQKNYPNAYLFLIGGLGNELNNIINIISEENIDNVIIIKNLENPYPILKKCDLFILSSYYEGLPMTIMESLILNIPILSVDIDGPKAFLEQGYAHIINNSEQGIQSGMEEFISKGYEGIKKFDAEKFNENAIKEFYKIINE